MTQGLRAQLFQPARAFAQTFRNPNIRRLELAWAASVTGEWSSIVALSVFAYDAGGPAAVGLVGLIRMLPSAVVAPFAALLSDRFRRERVMVAADLIRALAVAAAAAAVFAQAPAGVVFALAGLVALVSTAFRPAQVALLPALARTPEELTSANVASTTIESVAFFAGPALGGLLLAVTSTGVVFGAQAVTFLLSAFLVSRINAEPEKIEAEPVDDARGILREAFAGFRAIGADSRLRLIVGLFAAQTFVAGALNVLIVVMALELLDLGESGVGLLTSADGVGGLLGAAAALVLVGRRRIASSFGVGLVLWGLPIALIGAWPTPAAALVLLAVVGIGNTIADVAGLTLLQRAVPEVVLARVFGVLESLVLGAIALGAVVAPLLVSGLGVRGALLAIGLFLPILTVLVWRPLRALDAEVAPPGLELLRSQPIFAPLPAAVLERLASTLTRVPVTAGAEVFHQGDSGRLFYLVGRGEVEVLIEGRPATRLGVGAGFGEIALLRDVPRTATVVATSEGELFALDRDEFIPAVTGHAASAEAADAIIAVRLGSLRPAIASV
jgi:MFS family permease